MIADIVNGERVIPLTVYNDVDFESSSTSESSSSESSWESSSSDEDGNVKDLIDDGDILRSCYHFAVLRHFQAAAGKQELSATFDPSGASIKP